MRSDLIASLTYGRGQLEINLPSCALIDVVESLYTVGLPYQSGAVRRSLEKPLASASLYRLVRDEQRIAVVFSDISRAIPYPMTIPHCKNQDASRRLAIKNKNFLLELLSIIVCIDIIELHLIALLNIEISPRFRGLFVILRISGHENHRGEEYRLRISNSGNPFPGDIDPEQPQTLGLRLSERQKKFDF